MSTKPELNQTRESAKRGERGNVLFLILIAVALFAALSYAVTQSTRSGGGDASSETSLVNSAQITQYPASVKTAITRMIVSNSTSPYVLSFDDPSLFTTNLTTPELQSENVFHPSGGGATYTEAPASVMRVTTAPGVWVYNTENEIENIGQSGGPNDTTADTIAFLPDVSTSICQKIHQKLGLSTTLPPETNIDITTSQDSTLGTATDRIFTGGGTGIIGDGNILSGQPQGCFTQGGQNIYFHVLVER